MITLVSPMMLLGLSGLALPIMAHLLQRRASRRIVFPTVRLMREAAAGRSRLSALRRLLLLALRCLGVALLVLAFTQPVWSRRGATPPAENQGVGLVLVIDNSASAGRLSAGV